MNSAPTYDYLDPLYGDCELSEHLTSLTRQPLVQRLRDVRLSNIDSLSMLGVANTSRFEHSVGTAYLASKVFFANSLTTQENIVLQAAALLHDSAIQPFGHLVEESLKYVGLDVAHEERWRLLATGTDESQLGGFDLQIYMGRQSGLRAWAQKSFGGEAEQRLLEIWEIIAGVGRLGPAVCGDLDLDNLDNVTRAAYHMGLEVDRKLPLRIAAGMLSIGDQSVTFNEGTIPALVEWLELRSRVYERFMLSSYDFAGKIMLVYATAKAYQAGILSRKDWTATDRSFLDKLLSCHEASIADTVSRWLSGELWSVSNLFWMSGKVPSHKQMYDFSQEMTDTLGRVCFAYRIQDKTSRQLNVRLSSGSRISLGRKPTRWLLAVGSPIKRIFTISDNHAVIEVGRKLFSAEYLGEVSKQSNVSASKEPTLFELF